MSLINYRKEHTQEPPALSRRAQDAAAQVAYWVNKYRAADREVTRVRAENRLDAFKKTQTVPYQPRADAGAAWVDAAATLLRELGVSTD